MPWHRPRPFVHKGRTVRYDYEPYMWMENNEFKGFLVDVERTILERMGQKYVFVEFTNAEKVIMDIKDGSNHCAVGVPVIPDFEQILNLSDYCGGVYYIRISNNQLIHISKVIIF